MPPVDEAKQLAKAVDYFARGTEILAQLADGQHRLIDYMAAVERRMDEAEAIAREALEATKRLRQELYAARQRITELDIQLQSLKED